jgi:hypothetical protein
MTTHIPDRPVVTTPEGAPALELADALARVTELEAAIRAHRFDVGRGYHFHTFRSVHAANTALWAHVADRSIFHKEETTTQSDQLHRPAMMEDDRE